MYTLHIIYIYPHPCISVYLMCSHYLYSYHYDILYICIYMYIITCFFYMKEAFGTWGATGHRSLQEIVFKDGIAGLRDPRQRAGAEGIDRGNFPYVDVLPPWFNRFPRRSVRLRVR